MTTTIIEEVKEDTQKSLLHLLPIGSFFKVNDIIYLKSREKSTDTDFYDNDIEQTICYPLNPDTHDLKAISFANMSMVETVDILHIKYRIKS